MSDLKHTAAIHTGNADNTALIAEARAWAKDAARVGRSVMRDLDSGILLARRLTDALEAALAAAGVAPQTEWEYKEVGRGGEYVTYRRPKWSAPVGAWEPAPIQSDGAS